MFQPSQLLQFFLGLSVLFLSGGAGWSMLSGARVKVQAAGATLSVNERLKEVKGIRDDVAETVEELKAVPVINQQKISAYAEELEQAEELIEDTELKLENEVLGLIDREKREKEQEEN